MLRTACERAHHPAIQAGLEVYREAAPGPAQQASVALHTLLQELYQAPEPVAAWQFSRLTGDGFPLEFAFSTTDGDLRYTTEITGPWTPAAARLRLACQRLRQLGQPHLPAALFERLCQAQQGGALDYGAWVGGRHNLQGKSFKLYAEVPAKALEHYQPLLQSLPVPWPHLADRPVSLRMIGYHLASRRMEVYYRSPDLEVYHLARLMAPCGLNERSGELRDFLEEAYGYRLVGKLPGGSGGISYACSPDGDAPVFTLFLFARVFWGSDASIRRKLSTLAEKYGWDVTLYQRLTEPLAAHHTWKTYHGLLGLVVAPGAPIAISLGVRPGGVSQISHSIAFSGSTLLPSQ
jgi:hypothetical protein